MTEIQMNTDNDQVLFEFPTYEDFQRERVKWNYENTLKLWHTLPSNLANIKNQFFRLQTSRQQKKRFRSIKFFAFYSVLLKRTFLKNKVRSKGFKIWNDVFNMPPLRNQSLYGTYQLFGDITNQFLTRANKYDSTVDRDDLAKAGRTVWFMIAFQLQVDAEMRLKDSIFGYNMLYPYTDNFIDTNEVSKEAKKEFMKLFHDRLLIGEPTYDPNAHFNGEPSNANDLQLPPSLKPYADSIRKVFDMVSFIENDWKRVAEYRSLYMALATIHESQMKSTLLHMGADAECQPTMALLEEITAQKGGAALLAAGFLIEGRLTKAKVGYLEYMGFGLQLLDDMQDFTEDLKNHHRTVFTQTFMDGKKLDEPTARLIQYCFSGMGFRAFPEDERTKTDPETGMTLALYVRRSLMMFAITLVLEAASRLEEYYSREFYQELSRLSPIPLNKFKPISMEARMWTIVRNQWF